MKTNRLVVFVVVLLSFACGTSVLLSGGAGVAQSDDEPMADADSGRVIVKFKDDARVRLRSSGLISSTGRDLGGVRNVLEQFGALQPRRLFTGNETAIDRKMQRAEIRSGRDLADLNGYYEVRVDPDRVDTFLGALRDLGSVEIAYPAPEPMPPPGGDIPPVTPDYADQQGYREAAPGGIDSDWIWTQPGGRGDGVTIIDVEYDWYEDHEDLGAIAGQELCFTPAGNFPNHGTAVMGELGAGDNGFGVTGIVPDASFGMVTQDPVGMFNSVSRAIECATTFLGPGDVILMETQSSGPLGLVPSEWNQDVYDAVSIATALGIVVVSAAGNGNVDLDDPLHLGLFDRGVRDSGAIIVGAGASPNSSQPDRSRLSFSTYGSRVDVQGWGHNVTTTGYGDLFTGGDDVNQFYTSTFNGTSSASPIVTGAAAALQATLLARGAAPLDPLEIRSILTSTGSPQQAGPFPGEIGPRPNLRAAIESLSDLTVVGVVVDDAAPLGNADGRLDPGETATLVLTMENHGPDPATSIKGTLATLDPLVRVTQHEASWPDLPTNASADSLPVHHRVSAGPGASCTGQTLFTLNATSDLYADTSSFTIDLGRNDSLTSTDPPLNIPKNSSAGAVLSINVPDDFTVDAVRANIEILHGDIGELAIELRSPSATAVTLHAHTSPGTTNLNTIYPSVTTPDGPGTMGDFVGESSAGVWELKVVDDQSPANGWVAAWSLELEGCMPLSCAEPVPAAVDNSLHVERSGTDDLTFSWAAQPGVTTYRVWESTSLTLDSQVAVGQSAGVSLLEAGGTQDTAPLTLYQVRALNVCEWEGP